MLESSCQLGRFESDPGEEVLTSPDNSALSQSPSTHLHGDACGEYRANGRGRGNGHDVCARECADRPVAIRERVGGG